MKEAFRTGVVVAVALGAHAAPQLMPGNQGLVSAGAILAASITVDNPPRGCFRFHKAICKASQTRSAVMRSDIAQQITLREYSIRLWTSTLRLQSSNWLKNLI